MIKAYWVYAHLLCFALAFGLIARTDWQLFRQRHQALDGDAARQLGDVARLTSRCLAGLWISGAALLVIGYVDEGIHYLMNQKLWAKGVVVVAMTLNGVALHRLALPRLGAGVCVSLLPLAEKARLLALGGVSSASWLYGAFLGIARALNHRAAFAPVFGGYLLAIGACLGVAWLSHRPVAAPPQNA